MPRLQEIFRGKADILGNLSKQRRRDVPALMERDGRPASVSVSVLSVGASLANFDEAQPREERFGITSRLPSFAKIPMSRSAVTTSRMFSGSSKWGSRTRETTRLGPPASFFRSVVGTSRRPRTTPSLSTRSTRV